MTETFRKRFAILVVIAATLNIPIGTATSKEVQEEHVTIYRTVAIDYENPEYPIDEFANVLKNSPPVSVNVAPKQTLSEVIQSQLGLTLSRTPRLYAKALEEIKQLNQIEDPNRIKANSKLRIPAAPESRRKEQQVLGNEYYAIPRLSGRLRDKGLVWNIGENALVGKPYLDDMRRMAVRYEIQSIRLPKSVARRYALALSDDPKTAAHEGKFNAFDERLSMRLAGVKGKCVPAPILEHPSKAALENILKSKINNYPLMVVLDDSWPDDIEFAKAMRFIAQASDTIRKYFNMEETFRPDPMGVRIQLKFPTTTSFGKAKPYPDCQLHSAMIKASLNEFTELDKSGVVQVIYLPANLAQGGAPAAYKEILYVSQLALIQGAAIKDRIPVPNSKLPIDDVGKVIKYGHLAGPLLPFSSNTPSQTDKAIIDAVALFLELYSQASSRPHLLSLSWTTEDLTFPVTWRDAGYGLKIAAAGNDKGRDIFAEPPLQFATRAVSPGNLLAVENGDSTGLNCDSNRLPMNVNAFGLTFPGRVDAEICGTSYSAPRVAWLLALRLAVAKQIVGDMALRAWSGLERQRIGALLSEVKSPKATSYLPPETLVGP
jgi:LysM repeat protein